MRQIIVNVPDDMEDWQVESLEEAIEQSDGSHYISQSVAYA